MIKKSIYILCTSLALGCSACDDWLTVVPETTLIADNLLETDEGILQVLDGAYVLAASNVYKPTGSLGGGGVLRRWLIHGPKIIVRGQITCMILIIAVSPILWM